ncbi:hypothetical protein JG688_00017198 [Phytophthora aleatoria]|uniref:Uncharacterized protein n=1 Tax=Phytophthora aleatoria TaxID=2496075 RepID=A0A8J5MBX6_9STRA|nr:hypothetical protein JG688_00017198 [Phytophthora aleatoria]
MVKSKGLELSMIGPSDNEKTIKSYEATGDDDEREARYGIKTGLDEDRDKKLSIPDSEAKQILYEYYKRLFDKKVVVPFRLHPAVYHKNGVKTHERIISVRPVRIDI